MNCKEEQTTAEEEPCLESCPAGPWSHLHGAPDAHTPAAKHQEHNVLLLPAWTKQEGRAR